MTNQEEALLRLCANLAKRATVNGCDHENHELSTNWLDADGHDFRDDIYGLEYGEGKQAKCDCEVLRYVLPEIIGRYYDLRTLLEKSLPAAEAIVARLGFENARLYPAGEDPDDYDALLNEPVPGE